MIYIEEKPFATEKYVAGIYTDAEDLECPFTIVDRGENGANEIVWTERVPPFHKATEERILEHYKMNK